MDDVVVNNAEISCSDMLLGIAPMNSTFESSLGGSVSRNDARALLASTKLFSLLHPTTMGLPLFKTSGGCWRDLVITAIAD